MVLDQVMAPWITKGVTLDDVEAALDSDPSCTLLTYVNSTLHVHRPCVCKNREGEGEGEGGGGKCLPPPTRPEEEPWWRVRRRTAMIEAVSEAIELRAAQGKPVRSGLELVVCTGDCVTTTAHQDHHAWKLPTKSKRSAPAFTSVACAGVDQGPRKE